MVDHSSRLDVITASLKVINKFFSSPHQLHQSLCILAISSGKATSVPLINLVSSKIRLPLYLLTT